jgi:hypothetical protein
MKFQLDRLTHFSIITSLQYSSNIILSSSTFSYYFHATILKKLRVFSPQANYTDRATAAYR